MARVERTVKPCKRVATQPLPLNFPVREMEDWLKLKPLFEFREGHRITNGTPLENYRYYVRSGREMLGWPPLDGTSQGWGRMGF